MSEINVIELSNSQIHLGYDTFMPFDAVVEARNLEFDVLLQKRADCLIGRVALDYVVETEYIDYDIETNVPANLAEALELARGGDKQAEKMIKSNVTTDYLERAYKSGFISEVTLERRIDGEIVQYGQNLEDVHINSLRHIDNEKLRERAKIEALNSVRDKHYANNGTLKEKARVVFSMVHEDMDDDEATEVGFFTHTRSLSIQLMTEKDGELIMQSAFVAGRENLTEPAFDKQAVVHLAKKLGIDYEGQTTEGILGRPLIIDKKLLPNLASSLVELFDESATEVTGKQKFFGLDSETSHTSYDYVEKETTSKQIAGDMQTDIEKVVEKLKQLHTNNPTEATAKLAEYNDELLKQRIVSDETIDARVLGAQTAYYVNHARHLIRSNLIPEQQLQREIFILQNNINSTGNSSSCPGGSKSIVDKLNGGITDFDDNFQNDSDSSTPEDCEFISKECPKCGEKNVKTECKAGVYYGECGCSSK